MLTRKIGVLICIGREKPSNNLDIIEIKEFCCQHSNISFIDWVDERHPRSYLLKNMPAPVDGLLVLGCTEQKHIDKWRDVLENTQLPIFACEFVSLRELPAENTGEYIKLLIKAYTAKILAGWEVAREAAPVGIVKMFEAIDKPAMNRRQFLKMPLKLGKYEEVPIINTQSCIAASSSCQLCVDACATAALIKQEGKIGLKEDKCLKCGWCTVSCPFGCIQIPSFTGPAGLALLEELAPGTGLDKGLSLLITCANGCEEMNKLSADLIKADTFITIRVPSLASVSYLHLIRAVELGFSRIVLLCPESNCPRQVSMKRWGEMFAFVKELLEMDDMASPLELLIIHDKCDIYQLLNAKPNQPIYKREGYKESTHFEQKDYRLEFAQILKNFIKNSKGKKNKYYGSPLPFYRISINSERCSMCGSCWEKCPCQAITMEETPEGNIIKFNYVQCISCRTCLLNCAEGVISIEKVLDLANLDMGVNEVLKRDDLIKCKGCQNIIGTRSLIEKVNQDLVDKGWMNNAEKIYYCSDCQVTGIENDLIDFLTS